MEEDFELDRERIYRMRRMARKLAHNKSRDRVVRKLPQTMVVVMAPKPKRAIPVRKVINTNKRMTYILLLGLSLGALFYDVDPDTLQTVMQSVGNAAHVHLGDILGNT